MTTLVEFAHKQYESQMDKLIRSYKTAEEVFEKVKKSIEGPDLKLHPDFIEEVNKEYWDELNAKDPEERKQEFDEWVKEITK